jgi:hypothetical protein
MLDLFDTLITFQFEKRADPDIGEIMEALNDGGQVIVEAAEGVDDGHAS